MAPFNPYFLVEITNKSTVFYYKNFSYVKLTMIIVVCIAAIILAGFLKKEQKKS